MAKAKVTEELVYQKADEMVSNGEDPSIIAVQESIGGGSYSTVKRYLDQWSADRKRAKLLELEMPPEVGACAAVLAREVWAAATTITNNRIVTVQRERDELRQTLERAEQAIERLEGVVEQRDQQLEAAHHAAAEAQRQADQIAAQRAVIQGDLEQARQEIGQLRTQLQQLELQLREVARLEGELEAQRREIERQQAMITQLAAPKRGKGQEQ